MLFNINNLQHIDLLGFLV